MAASASTTGSDRGGVGPGLSGSCATPAGQGRSPCDAEFHVLCGAFAPHGGVARADALVQFLDARGGGGFVDLARLIGRHEVIAFGWRGSLWLPLFQMDLADLAVRAGPRRVLAELRPVLDGWHQAEWFVRPNGGLHGHRPNDLIDGAPERVVGAARVARFLAELAPAAETPDRRPP